MTDGEDVKINRRDFLRVSAAIGAGSIFSSCSFGPEIPTPVLVNDTQSKLNPTYVRQVELPNSREKIAELIWSAAKDGHPISICGGRHSMGGQQFAEGSVLIDTRSMNGVLAFDRLNGLLTVEAGIQWPDVIAYLYNQQPEGEPAWAIRDKQTGVDFVTIGGSVSSNIHGRGLDFPPFISAVQSLRVIDAKGDVRNVSRRSDPELFALVFGGYGLFGIVTDVTLQLVPRRKVERIVELISIADLLDKVESRIAEGFLYGDCPYAIDIDRDANDYPGILSCYRPVPDSAPITQTPKQLSSESWGALYHLTRANKPEAFRQYAAHYTATNGQVYWSDTHQEAGDFFRGYEKARDALAGSEIITEVYVSRENFLPFMIEIRQELIERKTDITFGTIRFIKKDTESFLAWAVEDYVCIVCNLHVLHTDGGKKKAAEDFRAIIDKVERFGGRFYLTYHRYATPQQVLTAYPQFREFLELKKKYDPSERFQSEWYRHWKRVIT